MARPLGPRVWFPLLRGALYADGNHPRIVCAAPNLRSASPRVRKLPEGAQRYRCGFLAVTGLAQQF
jgi:hypothetical protein